MQIYAILVVASVWLIHARSASGLNAPGYGANFRQGGPPAPAYRRAHHHPHHGKPALGGQHKKKWYPPQPNQRLRRPAVPAPPPPAHMGTKYMRQRLGLGAGAPPPQKPPAPASAASSSEFALQQEVQQHQHHHHQQQQKQKQQLQLLQQQQQQQQLQTKNFGSKGAKRNHLPSRNLSLQLQPQLPSQKPFLSSPKIQSEVEYHIQHNQIPSQPIMVKQLDDEKGPIHTIPAPNLSLADKPKQVHIHQPKPQPPPPQPAQPTQQHRLLQPHFESTTLRVLKPSMHQYQVTEPLDGDKILMQDPDVPPLKPEGHPANDDAFGLLPVQEGFAYGVLHQPQLQQHLLQQQQPNAYQTMLVQPQFFQPDAAFLDAQLKQTNVMATPPEMHTFNYVEPKHVSAEYALQADDANAEDGRQESYYTSLPSKDAADSFAQLHDAGRRPSAQSERSGAGGGGAKQQEMRIYVPDEQDQFDPAAADLEQYEANEGGDEQADKSRRFGFGSRLQPKKA